MGDHLHGPDDELLAAVGSLLALVGTIGYGWLVAVTHRRGWPRRRSLAWLAGSVLAAATVGGPLAEAADTGYPAHMVGHLLLGMVAPLLLVLAAPVTILLRALPVPIARRLSRALSGRPVRVLTEPAVAAVLTVGGMWLLYATPLYPAMHHHRLLHAVVHIHVFVSGYLFTIAMISVDPLPHRRSYSHRAVVLVLSLAAHDILAKYLYAHPPLDVGTAPAAVGSMIMYYGGDVVDVTILVLLGAGWYRVTGPRRGRKVMLVSA